VVLIPVLPSFLIWPTIQLQIGFCSLKKNTLVIKDIWWKTYWARTFKFAVIDGNLAFMDNQQMCLVIMKLDSSFAYQRGLTTRWCLNEPHFLFLPSINAPDTQLQLNPSKAVLIHNTSHGKASIRTSIDKKSAKWLKINMRWLYESIFQFRVSICHIHPILLWNQCQ